MACPKCGCKTTYPYDLGDFEISKPEELEHCAACGHIFDIIEEAADEDDDEPMNDAVLGSA